MGKRLPVTRPPAPHVLHYVNPSTPAEVAYPLSPAQLAARQRQQQLSYLRWKTRQEAIAARDRKARRFWLGFGAVTALVLLGGLVFAGWLLWTGIGLGVLAVPALAAIVGVLAVGGHRCITIVQHWH
jgi:fatty acid desaturase